MWNTETGSLIQTLEGPGGSVDWVTWHPKGDVVLAGSEDFTLWMWLAQSGSCMQVFAGHKVRLILRGQRSFGGSPRLLGCHLAPPA